MRFSDQVRTQATRVRLVTSVPSFGGQSWASGHQGRRPAPESVSATRSGHPSSKRSRPSVSEVVRVPNHQVSRTCRKERRLLAEENHSRRID